ncbi:unnamed protein product [Closterium sp. Naga37s-1]|nr:unnamed protein product [Closterium sp. Naga37s-1]
MRSNHDATHSNDPALLDTLNLTRSPITVLFLFGDSLVDVGNNHDGSHRFLRADLPPYGMSYIEASAHFSDGRLQVDYLARYLGLPSPPPVLQPGRNASRGLNFAIPASHPALHFNVFIKYPPLEKVRGLPEEIVGDEKEDKDFADVGAIVEGEEDEDEEA